MAADSLLVNGVDYGGLDQVKAPTPGTFSSPSSGGGKMTPAMTGTQEHIIALWVLLAIELLLLVVLRRGLRRHNGG